MNDQNGLTIAVVGATGAVGQQIIETLMKRDFPYKKLVLLSSARSAGKKVNVGGNELIIQEARPESFDGIDIALFSAGGSVSMELAPEAAKRGAIVIDNTSAFRMDPDVPLVVPEVNEEDVRSHKGIIANPNCSTIQMVVALEPVRKKYGLKKIIVSTYQAVSGAGNAAIEELELETRALIDGKPYEPKVLPVKTGEKHYQIAFNAIPQIDKFEDNGYTFEELKMMNETKKIMHDSNLHVAATCVRLPIETGHSESIYFEIESDDVTADSIKELLKEAPGVVLQDDPANQVYPMPADCVGKKDVFVGRIRKDLDNNKGFHMWVVSDNLQKGAAWNTVQIAESLVNLGVVKKK
ncbi:aspartate-semialdehyde dehydrogenase [Neobacillus notoginsengisoli]|uniref:Aspartate-semialdehyde dehydrogenase n=1 Tax=Neobacillus notoginsengisoli TaxID=1578198 RepID=A0A417YQ62_9BACI|nr:aspartate-semialdehyde dehydrogenase [Neobacillus notoginsengisoli]RHW36387.1 aspartate-semialdehyde dehydrogenase [Neobacillus notoginsengisoli]